MHACKFMHVLHPLFNRIGILQGQWHWPIEQLKKLKSNSIKWFTQVRKHRKCQCEDLKVDLYGLGSSYFTMLPLKKTYKRQMSDVVLPWGHERNVQTAQSRSIRKSFNYNPERNAVMRSWRELTWSQNPSQLVLWPHSGSFSISKSRTLGRSALSKSLDSETPIRRPAGKKKAEFATYYVCNFVWEPASIPALKMRSLSFEDSFGESG